MSGAEYYETHPMTQEKMMDRSRGVRRFHRWISMLFTGCVVANFVAMAFGPPPAWITYSPLPPLFLLMGTGLVMFFRPQAGRAG